MINDVTTVKRARDHSTYRRGFHCVAGHTTCRACWLTSGLRRYQVNRERQVQITHSKRSLRLRVVANNQTSPSNSTRVGSCHNYSPPLLATFLPTLLPPSRRPPAPTRLPPSPFVDEICRHPAIPSPLSLPTHRHVVKSSMHPHVWILRQGQS